MLTDAGAIALALVAARLAGRPAQGGFTFGLKRAEILSAQINGVTLVALAAVIVFEGIRRLVSPPDVEGAAVLVVALAGHRREPAGDHGPGRRRPPQPQRRGRVPARAHRPLRVHRHGDRRRGHPGHRLGGRPTASPRCWWPRSCCAPAGACCGSRDGFCSRPRRAESTPRRSAARWRPSRTWWRCTTSTCGRSPRACPRCRRT